MILTSIAGLWDLWTRFHPLLLNGLRITLFLAFAGTVLGLLLALLLVTLKEQHLHADEPRVTRGFKHLLRSCVTAYVGFFRGTPMLVQAMVFYYGLNEAGFRIAFLPAGLIVVSLNTAAYLTEVLRSGLNGLDVGQKEASLSLGFSHPMTYRLILLPQALKNMIPAIGNELIVNIKDTAVLSVIGVGELFFMARSVAGATFRFTEAFILVSIMYLITVMFTAWGLKRLSLWLGQNPKTILASESEGLV